MKIRSELVFFMANFRYNGIMTVHAIPDILTISTEKHPAFGKGNLFSETFTGETLHDFPLFRMNQPEPGPATSKSTRSDRSSHVRGAWSGSFSGSFDHPVSRGI